MFIGDADSTDDPEPITESEVVPVGKEGDPFYSINYPCPSPKRTILRY